MAVSSLLVLVLASALLWLNVLVAPTAEAVNPDETQQGSAYISSCIKNARTVNALVLLDKSNSLNTTDSRGIRYAGLRTALDRMSMMSRPDGKPLSVYLAVSAFGNDYTPIQDIAAWTLLSKEEADRKQTLDRLMEKVESETAATAGQYTNFEAGLEGSFADFQDRLGNNSCNLLLWFTDGAFKLENQSVDERRAEMCRPGGIVDKLRNAGIVIVGLQLGKDETELKVMALGVDGAQKCGTTPLPEGAAPGVFLQADDEGNLQRIFELIDVVLSGCTPAGNSGLIDPGIRSMRIIMPTNKLAGMVRLESPDGVSLDVPVGGGVEKSGYVATAKADAQSVLVHVVFPPGKGAGQWQFAADVEVGRQDSTFCVSADLALRSTTKKPVAGPDALFTAELIDPQGKPAAIGDYESATVTGTFLTDDKAPRTSVGSVSPSGAIELKVAAEPTDVRLDVVMEVLLTTKSGVKLTPIKLSFGQALALSDDYPQVVEIAGLDLGQVVKTKPAVGEITLIGSKNGPSRVCLGAATDLRMPKEAAGSTIDYQTGCVDLAANEKKTVAIKVTPKAAAEGMGSASVPVALHPTPAGQAKKVVDTRLPVSWEFTNPIHYGVLSVVALLVALLSVALPLLAISLANGRASRFRVAGMKSYSVPVVFDGQSLCRADGEPGLMRVLAATAAGAPTHPVTAFSVGGLSFGSQVSWNPGKSPKHWVAAPGQVLIATSQRPGDPRDGSSQSVPPGMGLVGVLQASAAALAGTGRPIPMTLHVLYTDRGVNDPVVDEALIGSLLNQVGGAVHWHEEAHQAQAEQPDVGGHPTIDFQAFRP